MITPTIRKEGLTRYEHLVAAELLLEFLQVFRRVALRSVTFLHLVRRTVIGEDLVSPILSGERRVVVVYGLEA